MCLTLFEGRSVIWKLSSVLSCFASVRHRHQTQRLGHVTVFCLGFELNKFWLKISVAVLLQIFSKHDCIFCLKLPHGFDQLGRSDLVTWTLWFEIRVSDSNASSECRNSRSAIYRISMYEIYCEQFNSNTVIQTLTLTLTDPIPVTFFTLLFFYFFTNRALDVWNSLPDHVVLSNTVNTFKSKLDKFWQQQLIIYDFKAELLGTGSRSWY